MVKALARAFRWRRILETGAVATVREIAAKEKINSSYVSRVLRLTLLAPAIVEAILDGRQPVEVTLPALMGAFRPGGSTRLKNCFRKSTAVRSHTSGIPSRRPCRVRAGTALGRQTSGPFAGSNQRTIPYLSIDTGHIAVNSASYGISCGWRL
jgi:hypothetical protein